MPTTMVATTMKATGSIGATLMLLGLAGCEPGNHELTVQVDTLPSGQVVVTNNGSGLWQEDQAWTIREDLRIGSMEGEGPEVFGQIASLAVDDTGKVFILESQAAEVRVFDSLGSHLHTIGRSGQGPGEFVRPVRIDIAPDGDLWVMDPRNTRLSVLGADGDLRTSHSFGGGFLVIPWRGGFDGTGRYYSPIAIYEPEFTVALGVYGEGLFPLDTLTLPTDPVERLAWEVQNGESSMIAGVPFQGGLIWDLASSGTIWSLVTDQYRLFELAPSGDTLRTILNPVEIIPVSEEERTRSLENLNWFTDQGGTIDPSMIPSHRPSVSWFFTDDAGHLWVSRITPEAKEDGTRFDIFDAAGLHLGQVEIPFSLSASPIPVVRGNHLVGVERDEFGVPFVVRATIMRD